MVRRGFPLLVRVVNFNAPFLAGASYPVLGDTAWIVVLLVVVATNGAVLLGRRRWLDEMDSVLRRSEISKNVVLALSSLVVTFGAAELLARGLVRARIVESYSAMRIGVGAGEDWRLAHITADRHREPDPVLLWQPKARWPYTSQRFKGPEVDVDKPAGTFRILCYGDSNTDGPPRGGWPEKLQDLLDVSYSGDPDIEVLNAGVAGYSSHQGLLRFLREFELYRPDLVLVSFGWNDPVTTRRPDKEYRPPPRWRATLERLLLPYSSYRVARRFLGVRTSDDQEAVHPRVSRQDYVANMRGFLRIVRPVRAKIAFLTRPHVALPTTPTTTSWRGDVPAYNRALLAFGERSGETVIDVQGAFAKRPEVFVDECHFGPEGHSEMAALLLRALVDDSLLPASGSIHRLYRAHVPPG